MKKAVIFIIFIILAKAGFSQAIPRYNPDTVLTVVIDSVVVIKSAKAGLSAEDFIYQIVNDTSFYEAFRNMKGYNFIAENSIFTYDKKDKVEGSLFRKLRHRKDASGKHKIDYLEEKESGKLYKRNGKYNLYTVEMFNYIFMNENNSDFIADAPTIGKKGGGSNESYKDKLKTLIFSPGRPIKGVPLISSKTEIFSKSMRQNYDYTYFSGTYLDSIPVYRFKVKMKDNLSNWTKDGIMIKELTTIFDKRNFQILGRYIDMKLDNMAFSFDVQMNIELSYFKEELLPVKISYQGNWDIPFKKEERASFLVQHKGYK